MKRFTKTKYGNKKTEVDGIKFDSKAEAVQYQKYKLLEKCHDFKILELQPKVYLSAARILYKPDFKVQECGEVYYVDVKGFSTAVFNLKKRLWEAYITIPLHIISKNKTEIVEARNERSKCKIDS